MKIQVTPPEISSSIRLVYSESTRRGAHAHLDESSQRVENSRGRPL